MTTETKPKKTNRSKEIIKYALKFKIFNLFLIILSSLFLNNFDQSSQLLLSNEGRFSSVLSLPFLRWDVIHFAQRSLNSLASWEYDYQSAFMPLLPMIMRYSGKVLSFVFATEQTISMNVLGGAVTTNLINIYAPVELYKWVSLFLLNLIEMFKMRLQID